MVPWHRRFHTAKEHIRDWEIGLMAPGEYPLTFGLSPQAVEKRRITIPAHQTGYMSGLTAQHFLSECLLAAP